MLFKKRTLETIDEHKLAEDLEEVDLQQANDKIVEAAMQTPHVVCKEAMQLAVKSEELKQAQVMVH